MPSGPGCDSAESGEQVGEIADRAERAGREPERLVGPLESRAEGHPLLLGEDVDAGLGPVADAAARRVEDAAQADDVVGVGDHPQVGQRVADLAPLVEPHAADDLVRQADADEHLFEDPGLRVGPVEHRDVAATAVPASASSSMRWRPRPPRRARSRRRSRRSARPRRPRTTGSSACGRGCGRSPRWRRTGSSASSGSSARAGSSSRRGSRARTRGCCGWSRRGRRRSTGRRRRLRQVRLCWPKGSPRPSAAWWSE